MEPTNITFFIDEPKNQLDLERFIKPTPKDAEVIMRVCKEGFEPNVSIKKCPKILPSLFGWALLKNELELRCDWENINHEDIIVLIYWKEIDEEAFNLAKDYFENLLGIKEVRDKVVVERYKEKFLLEKAPLLGGSEIVRDDGNELPDGRKVIAVVEGGEHEDLVNARITKIKQKEFHERPLGDADDESKKKKVVECC